MSADTAQLIATARRHRKSDLELALAAALEAAEAQRDTLAEALAVYADPRHWGISRDDLNMRVVSWIGPGADKAGLPDAMETARVALAAVEPPEERCTGYCMGVANVETLVEDLTCPVHGIAAQERAREKFPDRQAWLDSLAVEPPEEQP